MHGFIACRQFAKMVSQRRLCDVLIMTLNSATSSLLKLKTKEKGLIKSTYDRPEHMQYYRDKTYRHVTHCNHIFFTEIVTLLHSAFQPFALPMYEYSYIIYDTVTWLEVFTSDANGISRCVFVYLYLLVLTELYTLNLNR